MKVSGWIDFKYKLPYVNAFGGTPTYDYPIIVALKDSFENPIHILHRHFDVDSIRKDGDIYYAIMYASEATNIYKDPQCAACMMAWIAFSGYTMVGK